MTDNIDPRLAKERERVKAAKERLDKATAREKQIAAEVEVSKRKAEITEAVQGAVRQALSTLKLDIPPEGLTLFVHGDGEGNGFGVDVRIGRGKATCQAPCENYQDRAISKLPPYASGRRKTPARLFSFSR